MSALSLRLAAAGVGIALLASAYYKTPSNVAVTGAAHAFLNSLSAQQAAKAKFSFRDEERFNFHFIPRERKGLPLREMDGAQKHLAHALLSAGLSQSGYIKATSIMSLEAILKEMEKDTTGRRDPEGYFFSVFDEPSEIGTWGFRVEGHHLSLNFTIVNGKVKGAPTFFGTNPAEVRQGPRKGLRVLGREEDLARDLYKALDASQKKTALVSETAYKDILTAASRKAALDGQASGLSAAKMNAKQREMLRNLVAEYIESFPDQIAEIRREQLKKAGNNMYFAWAGVEERGGPHYYRVQTPSFLIEYDNTQNDANHVHAVWRDFDGDFGLDLLSAHYQTVAHHRDQ